MTIAIAVSAVLVAGSAMAQTTPPPVQSTPPPVQIPPTGTTQKPATPPAAAPKPTPVPFPADSKVAYIDLQRVVAESKLGKKGQEEMKKLNDALSSQLAAKNKEIQALQDKMKAQQSVVSDAAYNDMAKELDRLTRQGQFIQQDAEVQVTQKNQELLGEFQSKVMPLVEELRKEKNLWIIFAIGDNSNIAAANVGLDLSEELVKKLDATIK